MGTVMAAISFALKASYWLFQERRDVAPLRPQTFSAHLCIFQPCAYWGWLLRACRTSILLGNGFPLGEFHVFLASLLRKATFIQGGVVDQPHGTCGVYRLLKTTRANFVLANRWRILGRIGCSYSSAITTGFNSRRSTADRQTSTN